MMDESTALYPPDVERGAYGGVGYGGRLSPTWRGDYMHASPWRMDGELFEQVLLVSKGHLWMAVAPVLFAARWFAWGILAEAVIAAAALYGCVRLMSTCGHLLRVQLAIPLGNTVDAVSVLAPPLLLMLHGMHPAAAQLLVYGCVITNAACLFSISLILFAYERGTSVKCGSRAINSLLASLLVFATLIVAMPSAAAAASGSTSSSSAADTTAPPAAATIVTCVVLFVLALASIVSVSVSQGGAIVQSVAVPLFLWAIGVLSAYAVIAMSTRAVAHYAETPVVWAVVLPLVLTVPQVYYPTHAYLSFAFDEAVALILKAASSYLVVVVPVLHFVGGALSSGGKGAGGVLPLPVLSCLVLCTSALLTKLLIMSHGVTLLEGVMLACFYVVAMALPCVVAMR